MQTTVISVRCDVCKLATILAHLQKKGHKITSRNDLVKTAVEIVYEAALLQGQEPLTSSQAEVLFIDTFNKAPRVVGRDLTPLVQAAERMSKTPTTLTDDIFGEVNRKEGIGIG